MSIFISLGGFLLVPGCEEAKVTVAPPAIGDKSSRKVHLDSNLKMMFPNVDHKVSDMGLDILVTDVDQQGNVTVEVTITSLKVNTRTLGLVFAYNSEKKPEVAKTEAPDTPPDKKRVQQRKKQRQKMIRWFIL